jgi:cytoskeletal protein RodZ
VLFLSELGNRLKEARSLKGLSLDDLQEITKIQKRYLIGIEEGNFSSMPGKFYVRAFIKQYAEAVGLEPEILFEEFNSEIPNTVNDDIPEHLSRVQTRKSLTDNSSKVLDILPKMLISIVVIGVIAFVWYLLAQKNAGNLAEKTVPQDKQEVTYEESADLSANDKTEQPEDKTQKNLTDEKEKVIEEPAPPSQELTVSEANGDRTSYELKNADKFVLKIVSTGETWVNIKNSNGDSVFQGMLVKGGTENHTVDLSGEAEAVVVAGNSIATEIYVNDQKLEYAVSPTEEVRQDIIIRYLKTNQ